MYYLDNGQDHQLSLIKTNVINVTSVSPRLHIRKHIQDNSILNNNNVRSVMCDVLLLCRKQLHDGIILIRRQDRAHKTHSIPQLIIVVSLSSMLSIHMCLRGFNDFSI